MAQSTILLDKKKLEELQGRFASLFGKSTEAANLAENAEKIQFDPKVCAAAKKSIIKLSEDIQSIMVLIVNSFSSEDEKCRKQAESIVGVEIYNAVSSRGRVNIDPNGNYTVDYSPRLEGYEGIPQYGDECTNISCAMMLQRWMIAHDPNYTGQWGYRCSDKSDIHPYVEPWGRTRSVNLPDGHSFKTEIVDGGLSSTDMANLLSTHPEGVVIWGPYNDHRHAIVITRCELKEDGSYQFYAIDPSNVRCGQKTEIPLEDTHLYKNRGRYSSSDSLFSQSTYQYVTSGSY